MALGVAATAELSVGERAYSLALRSLADTKDTVGSVCLCGTTTYTGADPA